MQLQQLKVKIKSLAVEATIIRSEERTALRRGRYQRNHPEKPEGFTCNVKYYCYGEPTGHKKQPHCTEGYATYRSLYLHRKIDVGQEARSAILAYCFLRSKTYRQIEAKTKPGNEPNWRRVEAIARKFGEKNFKEEAFQAWIKQ